MSEIGSFTIRLNYQDDLRTPGMRPSFAASRKQARHMPKSRIKARLRPQRKQRLTMRDLNLGGRFDLATVDFFAIVMVYPVVLPFGVTILPVSPPKGTYQKKGACYISSWA